MSNGIHIIQPGFYTTVQDGGRFGYAHMGVPESGALDSGAYRLANGLLNNSPDEAVLECTLVGPEIKFECDVHIVITGARMPAMLDGKYIEQGVPVLAKAGHILSTSKIMQGTRAYIAFAGGLRTEIVLGSRSWFQPITQYSHLKKGMELDIGTSHFGQSKGAHLKSQSKIKKDIIASSGPEYGALSVNEKTRLQHATFTISPLWNRMAVQLIEPFENKLKPIRTSPVVPGTVQLTPSGKLIILLRDCQTTGGYPRVLQLSREYLDAIAQWQQGDQFTLTIA